MHLIMPFRGLRPAAGHAEAVIAPPYDVLSTAEARARAATSASSSWAVAAGWGRFRLGWVMTVWRRRSRCIRRKWRI